MVTLFISGLSCRLTRNRSQMAATGIVALFSGLSAASSGAHGSVSGLLSMLSAMRYVPHLFLTYQIPRMVLDFCLGLG